MACKIYLSVYLITPNSFSLLCDHATTPVLTIQWVPTHPQDNHLIGHTEKERTSPIRIVILNCQSIKIGGRLLISSLQADVIIGS